MTDKLVVVEVIRVRGVHTFVNPEDFANYWLESKKEHVDVTGIDHCEFALKYATGWSSRVEDYTPSRELAEKIERVLNVSFARAVEILSGPFTIVEATLTESAAVHFMLLDE